MHVHPAFVHTAALLLASAGLGACARTAGPPPELPEWVRREPGRCLRPRDFSENMETMARRCAEQFVAQNGYTDAEPSADTTRWVPEPAEHGAWESVFRARRSSLVPEAAAVQCSGWECRVFFEARGLPGICARRVVVMTQVFSRIHLLPGLVRTPCDVRPA
ncbi:MAG TPA: hypothetical protein VFS40_15480 [Gemmatimonadales bacterium]|nr:hypothetical protein [Gemmatimonadales bacterium]